MMDADKQAALAMAKMTELERHALRAPIEMMDADRQAALAMAKMTELERHALRAPIEMMDADRQAALKWQRLMEVERTAFEQSIAHVSAFADIAPWNHLPALRSEIDLAERLHSEITNRFSSASSDLLFTALRPSSVGMEHIQQTLKLSQLWERAGRSVAPLASSIACTGQQVAAQDEEIIRYPAIFDLNAIEESEDTELAVLPVQNLYRVQRAELVFIARTSPNALEDDETINSLPSFEYTRTVQAVCGLMLLINQQCATRGEAEIFKPTNQLMRALVTLPNLIAVSRDHFGQFIDYLYFMVYEGAGKDNLRFLGLIQSAAVEPVWRVKHIRNYDLRHDVEHGKPSDIAKKQQELGQDYLASSACQHRERDETSKTLNWLY